MRKSKFSPISAAVLLISSFVAGCASGPPTYEQSVRSAATRGWVAVNKRDNGVVVLNGWVEDYYSRQRVENVARQGEGVTRVINRLTVSN